jgi:glycosyltransferase involved in cell wall biosynthesis
MKTFRSELWKDGAWATRARVIYDAEAIFSFREAEQRRLSGEQVSEDEVARLLAEEMGLTEGVHAVFSVTDRERDYFRSSGVRTAWTLGHTVALNPTPRNFAGRAGFLFVGAMSGMPNRDAVLWFGREIWPKLRSLVGGEVSFSVVGAQPPAEIRELPDVDVLGQVADLTPLYDRSRIFVAPSRLAAGIPIKVQTAAAHGLPVVCTSILAEELGWHNEVELLVADDPEEFAKCCARLYSDPALWQLLRTNALDRVARECSHQTFADILAQALA